MAPSMRAMLFVVFVLGIASTRSEAQQLYKWVDKDGKVSYADTPAPKDAKDVKQKGFSDNITTTPEELPFSVKDAMKRNPVTLYANACGELCDKARALLNTRGIPFADRNPETDPAARATLKEVADGMPMPTLTMGQRVIKGFTESEWQNALTSSGYPRTNPIVRAKPALPAVPATPATAAAPAPAK